MNTLETVGKDETTLAKLMYTAIRRYCAVEGPDRTYAERRCNYEELAVCQLLAEGREIPKVLQPAHDRLTRTFEDTEAEMAVQG